MGLLDKVKVSLNGNIKNSAEDTRSEIQKAEDVWKDYDWKSQIENIKKKGTERRENVVDKKHTNSIKVENSIITEDEGRNNVENKIDFIIPNNKKQYCVNCGATISIGAKFCSECGNKVGTIVLEKEERIERIQSVEKYESVIHRCPHCREVIKSFTSHCPSCGSELRDVQKVSSVQEFAERLEKISSKTMPAYNDKGSFMKQVFGKDFNNEDKESEARRRFEESKTKEMASFIINYTVPNAKEDILEFMILASTNIDAKKGITDTVSKAWISKMEQVYKKAELTIKNSIDIDQIREIYNRKKQQIKNKKIRSVLSIIALVLIYVSIALILLNPIFGIIFTVLSYGTLGYFYFKAKIE